jgi:hypothetical protein
MWNGVKGDGNHQVITGGGEGEGHAKHDHLAVF